MEPVFAFKKESCYFRFFVNEKKELVLKIEGSVMLSVSAVGNFLIKKGIKKERINIKNLKSALAEASLKREHPEFIIATPLNPKNPTPVSLEFSVPIKELQHKQIKEGLVLATVNRPEDFVLGEDIFGNPIPYEEQDESVLQNLTNIEIVEDRLVASKEGIFVANEEENAYSILEKFNLFISDDAMTAELALCTSQEIVVEEIKSFLSMNKVTFGIDEAVVNIIALKTKVQQGKNDILVIPKTVVASGNPFIPGKDGYIEWIIDPEIKVSFEEDVKGNVNFKETNTIKSVKKGETIAIIHKERKGMLGINVFGKEVKPQTPHKVVLKAGKGVLVSDDKVVFMAEIDGMISYTKNLLSVMPLYEVNGNVDYSTGNISFDGTVSVKNDILAGFSVKAAQQIIVKGTIEACNIESEDSLVVDGGIPGAGEANIKVGKDLITKYISEANITVGNNLIVSNNITDATIKCFGSIIAPGCTIAGGSLFANRGMVAKFLGSPMGIDTTIKIGESVVEYEKYNTLKTENEALEKEIKQMEEDIMFLKNDPAQRKMVEDELNAILPVLKTKKAFLEEMFGGTDLKKPILKLAVLGKIYKGVSVEMNGQKKYFSRDATGPLLLFFNDNANEIMLRNLSLKEVSKIKKRFNKWIEEEEKVVV